MVAFAFVQLWRKTPQGDQGDTVNPSPVDNSPDGPTDEPPNPPADEEEEKAPPAKKKKVEVAAKKKKGSS